MALDLEHRTNKAVKIDSSSVNIPTGFDYTNASSLVMTGISYAQHLIIVNLTSSRIAYNFSSGVSTANPTTIDGYVPGKGASDFVGIAKDDVQDSSCIFIKSDTGSAISSGLVQIEVW